MKKPSVLTAFALALTASTGLSGAAYAQYVPPGGFEDETPDTPDTPNNPGNPTTIHNTQTTTNTNTAHATATATGTGGNASITGNTLQGGAGGAGGNGFGYGGSATITGNTLQGGTGGSVTGSGNSTVTADIDMSGALAGSGNSTVNMGTAGSSRNDIDLSGAGTSSSTSAVDLDGALAGSGNSSSSSGVTESGNSSSTSSADNVGNNNGNIAMSNVGSPNIVNSFRSYAYASGPAIGAAVDGCLAVVGTSGSIGVAGFNATLGGTRAKYQEVCAAVGASLTVFAQANGRPELEALALQTLMNALPEYFGEAMPVVVDGMNTAAARCAVQGQVVASPLAAFGLNACKDDKPAQPGYVIQRPVPPQNVNVNVTLQTQSATGRTAAAPASTRTTTRRRAAAPAAAPAPTSCKVGQTAVTTVTTTTRCVDAPAPRRR